MSTLHADTEVIPRLVEWAERHESVQAMILTSTRAIPTARVDELSDYDVILVAGDIHGFVDQRDWLGDFGEVLVAYWDPIHPDAQSGLEICANVVQYCDGLKLDFTLWPVGQLQRIASADELPAELDAGYQVLVDNAHLTAGMPSPTGKAYIPVKPDASTYQRLINDFLSDAPYVAKCLRRGELLPAKWCLDYDMKYMYLLPMLEWLAEIEHGWSMPVGHLGKGLKSLLPSNTWTQLEKTYSSSSLEDNWVALFNTLELFRSVARQVGAYLGYVYPEVLHDRVSDYLQRFKQISPQS